MFGAGMLLRQQAGNLRYMKPWQRWLVAVALLLGGVALIVAGVRVGAVAVLLGARLLWVMGRRRRQRAAAARTQRS
jgi:Flp pilus assembly protein TadB